MQFDELKLQEYFANHPRDISLGDVDMSRLPRHISFIMDGNGRWAKVRGLDRTLGHKAGVDSLREVITSCVRLGIDTVSAYAFSTENWKRPAYEVAMLMKLFGLTLLKELPLFEQENVKLQFIGDLSSLPADVQKTFLKGLDQTARNTGMTLILAVNYGSRAEIVQATKQLVLDIQAGILSIDDINDKTFEEKLYTHNIADPDLLIRTSGEMRLSNYLLWQIAYSELYVTDTFWPDFDRFELLKAIRAYQSRDRRFGGV